MEKMAVEVDDAHVESDEYNLRNSIDLRKTPQFVGIIE